MPTLVKALLIAAAATVNAAPLQPESRQAAPLPREHGAWDAGAVTEYQIHPSCNHTQSTQIALGLDEAIELAHHAKEHVLRCGNSSEHYRKYFGDEPRGEVIGYLDKIVSANKAGVLFRCDNPDGNCALEGMCIPHLDDH
jgi:Putative peptidase family